MIYKLEFETVSPCGAGYKFYANDEPICKPDEVPEEYWSKVSRDTDNPWQQYQSLKKWVETGEQLIRNFNLWKMDSEPKWALIEKWTLGSEVHAPQTPSASPIYKSPPSGPTDNDSKEEKWTSKTVRRDFWVKSYESSETDSPDSQWEYFFQSVANAHNAALSALRARLQKLEEATQYFAERLQSKHPRTGAWDSQCPLCGEATEVGDIIHDADCPFTLATLILSALSQTPSLVHSETEGKP